MFRMFRNTLKYGDSFFIRDPETQELIHVAASKCEKIIVNESKGKRPEQYVFKDLNLNLECKSAKGKKPMWNRGIPRPNALYIVSSKKLGRTTIFFGEDVLPEETYDRLMAVDQKYKTIINEVNDKHDDGWINYPRLAFDNRGKNAPNYWDRTFVDNVVSRVEEI